MNIRLDTYLVILATFFGISSYCQESKYYFQCEEGQNLESALKVFEENHNVKFAYPSYVLNQVYPGEYSLSDESLSKVLGQVLTPSKVEFQILESGEVLLRKERSIEDLTLGQKIAISGQILDGLNAEPLEFASVAIPSQKIGTYTDQQGRFSLDVQIGAMDEHILISFIGFESERLTVRALLNSKIIKLKSGSLDIQEITIEDSQPMIVVDRLSANTGIQLNGLLTLGTNAVQSDDILRRLQFLPGIGAIDDKSSSIQIRGADESETLVLIDGIPIYKTDHFYGIFSNVNGNYIEDVTLYKNEMPINYSGKSGGLVSMTSDSKIDEFSGVFHIDLLNSSLKIAQPLGGGWSFLMAGRASYNNVASAGFFESDSNLEFFNNGNVNFNRPTVLGITPSFHFYDFNTKLAYRNDRITFDANFFRSYDDLFSEFENNFNTRGPNRRPVVNEEFFSNGEIWKNNGASVNFLIRMKDNWSLKSTSYYSEFDDIGNLDFSVTNNHPNHPLNRQVANSRSNNVKDLGSNLMFTKKLTNTTFNIGANFIAHETNILLAEDDRTILNNNKSSTEIGAFGSIEQKLGDDFVLSGGLRADYYGLNNQIYFSPQLSGQYKLNSDFTFKSSFSINHQYVREVSYSSRFGEEIELFALSDGTFFPVGRSSNYMIGGTFRKNNWLFDLELYHIDRDNVLGFTSFLPRLFNNNENSNYRILRGEGSTNGADLMVSYQSKNYKSLFSYTLSKSENNFPEIFRNNSFPTQGDRRHQLSLTNTYSFERFDFSANAVYSSGRIFTDLNLINPTDDRRNVNADQFIRRLPAYTRIDLGAAYNFNFLHKEAKLELSILNVLNRENVKYLQFTAQIPVNQSNQQILQNAVLGTQTNQLGRTLNLSFKLNF